MKIYAIVVTYNGSSWIQKCFGSLLSSSVPLKVLAIDNGSTDGTREIIRKKFPQVEIIETGSNLGFGKANNIGLRKVLQEHADYAFLINQDAWIEKDTIKNLLEVHRNHTEFGLLSPVPYDGEEKDLDYLYDKFYKNGITNTREYKNKTFEIEFINAAGWLLTNDLIQKVGGFHPNFLMHGEDKNYIDRILCLKEFKIGICLSAKYFHDRKSRKAVEGTEQKRIYALNSSIKTLFHNPNKNILLLLVGQLRYRFVMLLKGEIQFRKYLQLTRFTNQQFIQSLGNRKIYYKP